ncbi:hypothetical protein [Haloarcula sediminis]|uniref:hypothetical protein n=1 Tax=Haloarcula sediminis TaxID=3111777 RepID=UPI002D78CB90|nr:hypothetical protein [Haloarcula sp. CK38]
MSEQTGERLANRRDVLHSSAVLGSGLLVSAFAGESVATDEREESQTEMVGYISRSSYRKLTGSDEVDCVPGDDVWGGGFYVKRAAEDDDGAAGVSVSVPETCSGDEDERHAAYTVTADATVDLTGGPNGHGPWGRACGSWVFVGRGETPETDTVYRVTGVQGPEPPAPCHEGVTATDSEGEPLGGPMDLVRISFERAPPAEQWTQTGKFTECGGSVAVDGTTAVLGPGGAGPACVLTRTDGGWTQETTLADGDDIRGAPAFDGDTVLFGGPRDGDTGNSPVLAYAKTDGSWEKQATLLPGDLDEDADFGDSYDVDGDTIVVGAPQDPGTNDRSEGAVYVYTRFDGDWSLDATLEDSRDSTDTADGLGNDVAVDGDTILAGAPYAIYYAFGFSGVGGALVFTRSDEEWTQETFLRSDNPDNEDGQGTIVAVDGDTAVLANPRAPGPASEVFAGAAWVFTREGSEWDHQQKVTPDNWGKDTFFAPDVALDGDTILAGASTTNYSSDNRSGAAYIFARDSSTWEQQARLTAPDREPVDQFGAQFGKSVALAAKTAFVGAPDDENPDGTEGSVYAFEQ